MPTRISTYDTDTAKQANLKKILNILSDLGANNVYEFLDITTARHGCLYD